MHRGWAPLRIAVALESLSTMLAAGHGASKSQPLRSVRGRGRGNNILHFTAGALRPGVARCSWVLPFYSSHPSTFGYPPVGAEMTGLTPVTSGLLSFPPWEQQAQDSVCVG